MSGTTVENVVSAKTSAGYAHGGHEATILSLYTSMMHCGEIIVPPGYTDDSMYVSGGKPYGVSVTVDQDGNMVEDIEDAVKHQAKRTLDIANRVKAGE